MFQPVVVIFEFNMHIGYGIEAFNVFDILILIGSIILLTLNSACMILTIRLAKLMNHDCVGQIIEFNFLTGWI